ncbi:MAG: radical SAM protein [Candidatus Nanoarchaeia archaeon]|nr:radical SAM protein [Candidatus Nanoarchaeia archaeon]
MKCLFLNPPNKEKFVKEGRCQHEASFFSALYPPITLAICAQIAKDSSHEVDFIDAIAGNITIEDFLENIKEYDFILVDITTPTFINDANIIKKIKEKYPKTFIAIYGFHANYDPKRSLKESNADAVLVGEPEAHIQDFLKNPKKGVTEKKEVEDLDSLPFPARDLMSLEKYRLANTGQKFTTIVTGRGCPFNCSFCVVPFNYGRKARLRSPEIIVKEIKECVEKYNIKNFWLNNDTFTIKKDQVMELCNLIEKHKLKINWMSNSRVDTVDLEMFQAMKKSGCWLLSFGIESGNPEILKNINKNITLDKVQNTIKNAKKAKLLTMAHYVLGLPGETEQTIDNTINFAIKLDSDFADFFILTPFPGAKIYEDFKKEGILEIENWDSYRYAQKIFKTELPLEKYQKQAYRKFYLRPKKIIPILKIVKPGAISSMFRFLKILK